MKTIPEIIDICMLECTAELSKFDTCIQDKDETMQKLIHICDAASMIYDMGY